MAKVLCQSYFGPADYALTDVVESAHDWLAMPIMLAGRQAYT